MNLLSNKSLWITISITVVASLIGLGSYHIFGPDNQVEETCEKVIQDTTGASIDLTPTTPEVSSK